VLDLNHLRVFERVAALRSFSAAARALGLPKSSVSRGVARLEAGLGTRLLQRTTREVVPTEPGRLLQERCTGILAQIAEATDQAAGFGAEPRGRLRVSAGIGFGIHVLSEMLPRFLNRYAGIDLSLDLTSRLVDLVGEEVDVAIRLGPMPDSRLVARHLGTIQRFLCAAPGYLERRGTPRTLDDLRGHDAVEMPGGDGRPRPWVFTAAGGDKVVIEVPPRLTVNEALTIQRLVLNGAGLGVLSGYMCAPGIAAGRLVRLFPEWTLPPVEVNVVFPSNRELAPSVRAFVDFLKQGSVPGQGWLDAAMPG
jgi:LysR family transcriptional regulator for bpeEF and oprC